MFMTQMQRVPQIITLADTASAEHSGKRIISVLLRLPCRTAEKTSQIGNNVHALPPVYTKKGGDRTMLMRATPARGASSCCHSPYFSCRRHRAASLSLACSCR